MTATSTPQRSARPAGHAGFGPVLHAEWTKFRTVRGWVIGVVAATLVMLFLGLMTAFGSHADCGPQTCTPHTLVGPGGQAVIDSFYFAHQSLDGDGSLTVRVASLTGQVPAWLQADHDSRTAKVLRKPERREIAAPVQEQLIVELYSK